MESVEDFISIEEVIRIFKKFCNTEISACGSPEEECETCLFYKKYIELIKKEHGN